MDGIVPPFATTPPATQAPGCAPLLTSASRGWKGVEVELHQFRDVDHEVPMPRHSIGIHLAGAVNLLQSRNGRSCVKHVCAGDVTISPCGDPKRFQHSGENLVLLLKVEPAYLREVAQAECHGDPRRFELREVFGSPDPRLVTLGGRMLDTLGGEGLPARLRAEGLARQIALHLLCNYGAAPARPDKPPPRLSPRNLQRAIDFIDAHLRDDTTLASVARELAMSPGHFAHAFKESTGLAPHRFVIARRIELAKALLKDTDLPITQIAHQVGCASHSHFSVVFLRSTGRTPRAFRGLA